MMVSALVTSPWLHERIFSGEASEILMALKSFNVCGLSVRLSNRLYGCKDVPLSPSGIAVGTRENAASDLEQLDVEAEALQLADEDVERLGQARVLAARRP